LVLDLPARQILNRQLSSLHYTYRLKEDSRLAQLYFGSSCNLFSQYLEYGCLSIQFFSPNTATLFVYRIYSGNGMTGIFATKVVESNDPIVLNFKSSTLCYTIYIRLQRLTLVFARFPFIRKLSVWNYYRDYFPIKLVKTADLDPSRNYLLGYHPHGILCSGAFSCFHTDSHDLEHVFPGLDFHILTLELNFKFPLGRELLLAFGERD